MVSPTASCALAWTVILELSRYAPKAFPGIPLIVYNTYKDISQLPPHVFDEMKHFFSVYKTLESKETAIDEVKGVLDAVAIIEDAIEAYKEKFEK